MNYHNDLSFFLLAQRAPYLYFPLLYKSVFFFFQRQILTPSNKLGIHLNSLRFKKFVFVLQTKNKFFCVGCIQQQAEPIPYFLTLRWWLPPWRLPICSLLFGYKRWMPQSNLLWKKSNFCNMKSKSVKIYVTISLNP